MDRERLRPTLPALTEVRVASALRALRCWPSVWGWLDCAGVGALASGAILAIGFGSGLFGWAPSGEPWLGLLLKALLAPALVEEILFRGLLSPARGEVERPATWIALGLAIFVLWHVLGGLLFPGAEFFLRPSFLLCAALLGLACALMRYRTGSLWPPVAFHAVAVWAWQALLGGISPADLL
jgi:predicted Abi (CAAX) family protease